MKSISNWIGKTRTVKARMQQRIMLFWIGYKTSFHFIKPENIFYSSLGFVSINS